MGTWITISQSGMMMPDEDSFERNTTIEDRQQGASAVMPPETVSQQILSCFRTIAGYLRILAEPYLRR